MKFGANNKSTCSDQYWEYSTREVGDRMNGGAVNDDKSPLYEAIDFIKEVQDAAEVMVYLVQSVWNLSGTV